MTQALAMSRSIAATFRHFVLEQYLPRIRACVNLLSDAQVWYKPSAYGNSVGNLLLHLAGNTRQWIQVGLGGDQDQRDRSGEFAAEHEGSEASPSELVDRLEATVKQAVALIDGLTPEELLARVQYQGGKFQGDGLHGVLHVLEHFSCHAGQIYAYTKATVGIDLKFYDL